MPHTFNSGLKRPSSTSYLNCPLKKRPLKYDPEIISNDESTLNEPENLSTKPEDLRLKKPCSPLSSSEDYCCNWTMQKGPLEPLSQNHTPSLPPPPPTTWLPHHEGYSQQHSSIRYSSITEMSRVSHFTPTTNYCSLRDSPPHISPPLTYEPAYPVIRIEENFHPHQSHHHHHQSVTLTPHHGLNNDQPSQSPIIQKQNKIEEKEGVIRYQCPDCSKSYSTFSGLSKHVQFHCSSQNKKSFICKFCEKVYVSLGALKMHIRTHTLPCKCTLCGKAFSRPWLLQGHLRTHSGEKPFVCQHCNRAFADRSNLRAHLQTHSEVKKYSCKSCSKTFSRMSLLVKHEEANCRLNSD